jgi:hypothetical protein
LETRGKYKEKGKNFSWRDQCESGQVATIKDEAKWPCVGFDIGVTSSDSHHFDFCTEITWERDRRLQSFGSLGNE